MKTSLFSRGQLLVLTLCLIARAATATPLYFATTDSYYESVPTGLSWDDARTAAASTSFAGRIGRLATVTSTAENNFLVTSFLTPGSFGFTAWIGGYQPAGDIGGPGGGWEWITGETWSYTNWLPGEPNDAGGSEDTLQLSSAAQGGQWNDHESAGPFGASVYIIEYAAVPEPSTLALAGLAGAFLLIRRRGRFFHRKGRGATE